MTVPVFAPDDFRHAPASPPGEFYLNVMVESAANFL
jgi:hypothetical protein